MTTTPVTQEQGASGTSQPPASIYVMPERFLALTRAAKLPVGPPVAPRMEEPVSSVTAAPVSGPAAPAGEPTAPPPPSRTQSFDQPADGRRRLFIVWGIIGGGVLILGGLTAFFVLRSLPEPAPSRPPVRAPASKPTVNQPSAPSANVAPVNVPPVTNAPSVNVPPVTNQVPANVAPPSSDISEPAVDKDTDRDGLTDAEEILLGTDINLKDTDGDGYDDRTEVLNLYNPLGVAPQKIIDAGPVFEYENPKYSWRIYLPKQWSVAATDQDQKEVVITTQAVGEEITLRYAEMPSGKSVRAFAEERLVGTHGGTLAEIRTKRGATCFRVVPPEVICASSGGAAIEIAHYVQVPPARYSAIFEMILQSFTGAAQ